MASPLEIGIALHYWTTPTEYDGGASEHFYSPATQEILSDFVSRGFLLHLDKPNEYGGMYRATEALGIWVDALCNIPFPVQQWVIPALSQQQGGK
jgi:hypothetical protein